MTPHEPRPLKEELEILKRQVQSAIEMEQHGQLRDMSEKEIRDGVQKYGYGTFLIGDFAIRRIQ